MGSKLCFDKFRRSFDFYNNGYKTLCSGCDFINRNDLIKHYDEVRKVSTWQCDDYTTGFLLDFAYFEKNYRLIAADLSKQKALDADSRAIQQINFTGKVSESAMAYNILEQSEETILQFSKGTTKVLWII